ncbi:MAG: hypothetical protein Q8Q89_03985 [bacterium]|nr:hypothetical protein [bacterium]
MKREEVSIVGISGINFPVESRKYLMKLVKDIINVHSAKFVIVAGNTINGRALEAEFKAQLRFELKDAMDQHKANKKDDRGLAPFDKERFKVQFEREFIRSVAQELNQFFPALEGVNYHFVISEKVYDRPIGTRILEELRRSRDDFRLLGEKKNGTYDTEVKVPVNMRGFNKGIRVIVPRKAPWFYRIITSFMQTLISRFIPRTFSGKPDLILVGCTGTAAFLPFYEGVPSISIPALHKIDEHVSTENMVGCSLIRLIAEEDRTRIVNRTYDFRTLISHEKELAIPADSPRMEKRILNALLPSSASLKTLLFRINTLRKSRNGHNQNGHNGVKNHKPKILKAENLKEALDSLSKQGIIAFNGKSNRYEVNEKHLNDLQVSLDDMLKDSTSFKQGVFSCYHGGSLKTLYHTVNHYLPPVLVDKDVVVENGDEIQGIAHNYEYNGELLPIARGYDKQEIMTGSIRAKNLLDVFKLRLKLYKDKKLTPQELVDKCLITYIFNLGNHPSWKHYQKDALILNTFEMVLKNKLLEGIISILRSLDVSVDFEMVKKTVDAKVVRLGESMMVNTHGITLGIKHPWKGRTQSKSHRIQDVVDFFWRTFDRFAKKTAKNSKGFALVNVANFHEAASVHVVKFGKTVLGVMTGAYLKDTSFESHNDKVVDFGPALVHVCLNKEGLLLYSEVEFDDRIHPDDERIVLADRLLHSDVLKLSSELTDIVDIPWR